MKNQRGASLPILIIIVALIIIIAAIIVKYGMKLIEKSELQDLRTNMLLIQAETKKDLEEVCFQTVNLDKNKVEDLEKIKKIKKEELKGEAVQGSGIENYIPKDIEIDENCYYLNEQILNEIGVKETNPDKYGYYIVKYNFEKTTVDVLNTKGYEEQYTLQQLLDD